MYALKHLKRFFRQLRKNRKIVESKIIDNVILRRSCDLTRKIVCVRFARRELKLTETEVNGMENSLRGNFSFCAKVLKNS